MRRILFCCPELAVNRKQEKIYFARSIASPISDVNKPKSTAFTVLIKYFFLKLNLNVQL